MGFGLAIAVLGIGSTFAANININGGQDTEFGQGRTRTVFCGGDEKVTIAPISTYVNRGAISSGSDEVNFMGRFGTSYIENVSGSYFQHTGAFVTVNGIEGLWLTNVGSGGTKASNQTLENVMEMENIATYVFSPKATRGLNVGVYKVNTFTEALVVVTAAVLPNPPTATFRTAGVLISDIPEACDDVVFVLSFFGETGNAQTMISKDGEEVKEVAYTWYSVDGNAYAVSKSRTSYDPTTLVTASTTEDSLKFIFNLAGATAIEADDLDKIVIETQPDSILDVSP
jgi:hypothetical protein